MQVLSPYHMTPKTFCDTRLYTFLAFAPGTPQDPDIDLSDADPVDDPDTLPTTTEDSGDTCFDSMDEENVASTRSSSKTLPKKKRETWTGELKTVSLTYPQKENMSNGNNI